MLTKSCRHPAHVLFVFNNSMTFRGAKGTDDTALGMQYKNYLHLHETQTDLPTLTLHMLLTTFIFEKFPGLLSSCFLPMVRSACHEFLMAFLSSLQKPRKKLFSVKFDNPSLTSQHAGEQSIRTAHKHCSFPFFSF